MYHVLTLSTNNFCKWENERVLASLVILLDNIGRKPVPLHGASSNILSNVSTANGGPASICRFTSATILVESAANIRTHFFRLTTAQLAATKCTFDFLSMPMTSPYSEFYYFRFLAPKIEWHTKKLVRQLLRHSSTCRCEWFYSQARRTYLKRFHRVSDRALWRKPWMENFVALPSSSASPALSTPTPDVSIPRQRHCERPRQLKISKYKYKTRNLRFRAKIIRRSQLWRSVVEQLASASDGHSITQKQFAVAVEHAFVTFQAAGCQISEQGNLGIDFRTWNRHFFLRFNFDTWKELNKIYDTIFWAVYFFKLGILYAKSIRLLRQII